MGIAESGADAPVGNLWVTGFAQSRRGVGTTSMGRADEGVGTTGWNYCDASGGVLWRVL